MSSDVLTYLLRDEHVPEKVAAQILRKMERHPDILAEVRSWIASRNVPPDTAISVEGYTAEELMNSTYLRPIGAYNYLIYLREDPARALADLARGLPRK